MRAQSAFSFPKGGTSDACTLCTERTVVWKPGPFHANECQSITVLLISQPSKVMYINWLSIYIPQISPRTFLKASLLYMWYQSSSIMRTPSTRFSFYGTMTIYVTN